jgi:ferredoxin--NADP+ reductase
MSLAKLEISPEEIEELRSKSYNATVQALYRTNEELAILRVVPDAGPCHFSPGQYTTLGLGYWEPRVSDAQPEELDEAHQRKMVRRAYSFSSPILDEQGELVRPDSSRFVEFYIVLIRQGEEHPPGLTPRLFALSRGDRLHLGKKVTGHYTLDPVRPDSDVIFVATGTGEAPHNTMLAELLANNHQGRIVTVTCVRKWHDLGYLKVYDELESRYENFRYLPLTTREPENLDSTLPNYRPKQHMQGYFDSGCFEADAQMELDPATCSVFLCGNPAMIGAPEHGAHGDTPPSPKGMVHLLQQRGFTIDEPKQPGNIHFEKYW